MKKFTVTEQGTNSDLLGSSVGSANVFISMYPVLLNSKCKPVSELEVGEKTSVTFDLNSNTGKPSPITAWIERVQ